MNFSFKDNVMSGLWRLTKKGAHKGRDVFFGLWDVEPLAEKDRTEEGLAGAFIRKRKEKLESRERFWGRLLPADRRELAFLKREFETDAHKVTKKEIEAYKADLDFSRIAWFIYVPVIFYAAYFCASSVITKMYR